MQMVGNHTVNGTDFAAERKPFILFAVSEQRANVHSVCFHDEKKKESVLLKGKTFFLQ